MDHSNRLELRRSVYRLVARTASRASSTISNSTEPTIRNANDTNSVRRALYSGGLGTVGFVFALLHLPHLAADVNGDMGLLALITGAILPFVLGVLITVFSYALWRSDLPASQTRRVFVWFLFGGCGMSIIGGALMVYQSLEGVHLSHVRFLMLDFATAGGVVGMLIGWYDARARLQAMQLRIFEKAIEHCGHCVYLTFPNGTIEYVNPEFESQTGFSKSEAIGENPRILKSGVQDNEFYERLWNTIISGEVWQAELVNARKDGTHHYVDQTIAPVMDGNGEVEHFVAINRDTTRRKEREKKLERQNERLDEFASVVSHDLRNPMNVAQGRIELANETSNIEHLDAAERALSRMEQLIEDSVTRRMALELSRWV